MGTAAQQNTSHGRATKGTAVVTGASSGLGAVFADRLASRGYDLILVARRADRLRALETRLSSQYSISAKAAVADLAAKADLDSLIEKIRNDSSITMLVNDAGTASMKPLTSIVTQSCTQSFLRRYAYRTLRVPETVLYRVHRKLRRAS
jgi:short-subunit dehydrogenase